LEILEDPSKYTGQAYERAIDVCDQRESEICQLREYLKDEKEVLSTTKAEHFGSIYEQVRAREAGEPAPKGFCPAENRKKFLKAWIEDVKLNKQRTNNIVEMKKGVNS
ncbi:MAG: hypothetical protein ACRD98_10440, partial [Nitrososphaera sp.]